MKSRYTQPTPKKELLSPVIKRLDSAKKNGELKKVILPLKSETLKYPIPQIAKRESEDVSTKSSKHREMNGGSKKISRLFADSSSVRRKSSKAGDEVVGRPSSAYKYSVTSPVRTTQLVYKDGQHVMQQSLNGFYQQHSG